MAATLTGTDATESLRFDHSIHKIDSPDRRSAHWRAIGPRTRRLQPVVPQQT
jgi:hypothetical protein